MSKAEWNQRLFGCCENLNLDGMKACITEGGDPNQAVNEGWDCDVLHGCLQTYTRQEPEHFHTCINTLIDAGAKFEDGPLWDLFRGRADLLNVRIDGSPNLVHERFGFDYGDHLTLRGATLLHIAVEYNLKWAVDVLLERGADLNAQAEVGKNGVGGQTPLFHAIGSNQGRCYDLFEYVLEKGPDLSVVAKVQENAKDDGKVMDCIHKEQDHSFDAVREVTPLGYALWYEQEPKWRSAKREVEKLKALGAPAE